MPSERPSKTPERIRTRSASARCEVTFEFALGDRIYRARRSPAQERSKKRGEGVVLSRPEAHLVEVKGDVEVPVCPPRVAEVDQAVTERLGLTAVAAGGPDEGGEHRREHRDRGPRRDGGFGGGGFRGGHRREGGGHGGHGGPRGPRREG